MDSANTLPAMRVPASSTAPKDSRIHWLGQVPAHWTITQVGFRYSVELGKMLDSNRIAGDHLAPYLRNVDVQWDSINTTDLPEMDFDVAARDRYLLRTVGFSAQRRIRTQSTT